MVDIINTTNLTKAYGKTYAVHNVNLSVRQGEIFGFIGLNGAGKTTTIKMLLGMVSPTSGSCYLKGQKVNPANTDIWSDVGYIVETPYAYPELTVRENLEMFSILRKLRNRSSVDWIIKKLKLEEHACKKVRQLSLGNAQRLGIAKALIHKPKILILDEPTNGLDPAGIVEIIQLLIDLAKNSDVTIFVSSHKLNEISRLATNIAIIDNGKIIKVLSKKQLDIQLERKLILDGKDKRTMRSVLSKAGYKVYPKDNGNSSILQIRDKDAINNPDKIAQLLVNSNQAPTLLKVENEDLEDFFLKCLRDMGGR